MLDDAGKQEHHDSTSVGERERERESECVCVCVCLSGGAPEIPPANFKDFLKSTQSNTGGDSFMHHLYVPAADRREVLSPYLPSTYIPGN